MALVYKGGGYWRDDSVPAGQVATILHGEEALREAVRRERARITNLLREEFPEDPELVQEMIEAIAED